MTLNQKNSWTAVHGVAKHELLNLLPIETPIKIGNLSQQQDMLSLDVSVFERNFTVFVEKDSHKTTFISNCIRQLFQMKEKSVVIDTCNKKGMVMAFTGMRLFHH